MAKTYEVTMHVSPEMTLQILQELYQQWENDPEEPMDFGDWLINLYKLGQ